MCNLEGHDQHFDDNFEHIEHLCESREIRNNVLGIADALYIHRLSLLVDGRREISRICCFDPLDGDTKFLQEHCQRAYKLRLQLSGRTVGYTFKLIVTLFSELQVSMVCAPDVRIRTPPYKYELDTMLSPGPAMVAIAMNCAA